MQEVNFAETIELLQRERRRLIECLGDSSLHAETLRLKLQLDDAIGCLRLCQENGITPAARVIRLPEPQNVTPSSEFRLIEDRESDHRDNWIEVKRDGEPIRPLPGTLLIEPDRPDFFSY